MKSKEPIHINNPQCEFTMPPLSDFLKISHVRNITDNKYELNLKINISKTTCIEAVYIIFSCDTCLETMNGKIIEASYSSMIDILLRHGKKEIIDSELPDFITESNFVVNVTSFNYTVSLNIKKNLKDYLKFLESFGEGAVNFGNFGPSDTIYKYDGVWSI